MCIRDSFYTEAARLAFADRGQFVADPDFVQPPGGDWRTLWNTQYLKQRSSLIGAKSMKVAQPGNPAGTKTAFAPMQAQEEHGTSHISVIDKFGNAVAITTTIEAVFGSRNMVNSGQGRHGGFLLNNELTDFSYAPADAKGMPIAKPKDIRFGENLPKTRSGKIMRRLLRSLAKGEEITQDISTLENPAILGQLGQTY